MIQFTIDGKPQSRGSKTAFKNKYTGRAQLADSNPKSAPYIAEVKHAAKLAMQAAGISTPLQCGVHVRITFRSNRPKGHYGTGRNAGVLKDSSPTWKVTKPDIDKLARAVLDGMSKIVYHDDSFVVTLVLHKAFAPTEGVDVIVTPME